MSVCISSTGEHTYNDNDWCYHCGHNALRDKLALIEVTVALWEAGAAELRKYKRGQTRMGDGARAGVMESHAEMLRDILKGE